MTNAKHKPEWWDECYFAVSPAEQPPTGLSQAERPLFDHQRESVDKLRYWFSQSESTEGVLCLPTGGGKTRTAVYFILTEVLVAQKKVLWLTHRKELLNQTIGTFLESSLDAPHPYTVGRFGAQPLQVRSPVDILVASIPTLAHRKHGRSQNLERVLRSQREFGLIVIDECHHGVARSWSRLVEELRNQSPTAKLLGLSATPTRSPSHERPEFWRIFRSLVHEVGLIELINQKVLARPRVETVPTGFEVSADANEKTYFERFHDLPFSVVKRIASDEGRNGKVVSLFRSRRGEWGQTLIFAATVEQGNFLTRELKESGIAVEEVYADTPGSHRSAIVDQFRRRELDVLVNVGLFTEGTDLPGVQSVFIARPTRSPILFRQMVGRGLRGPKIGGSAECTVVAFYDEVSGLVAESLASSFRDEREAIVALGLNETNRSGSQPALEPDEDASDPDDEADLRRLADELRYLLRKQLVDPIQGRKCALAGWWETVRGNRRAFLPVFDDVEVPIRKFVEANEGDLVEFSNNVQLPYELVRRFFALARRREVKPRYFDIEDITQEQLRAVLDDIAQCYGVPDEIELGWLGGNEEGQDKPQLAIRVDGRLVRIDQEAYSTLRNQWNRYGADFAIFGNPDLSEALAKLLLANCTKLGISEGDAMALLDAAAESGVFPDACRISTSATLEEFLTVLRYKPINDWPHILDKAWTAGLQNTFRNRNHLLLSVLTELVTH